MGARRSLLAALLLSAVAFANLSVGGTAAADNSNNDTIATAEAIAVGREAALPGQISPAADQDYYRFTAKAGNTYVIEVFGVAAELGSVSLTAFNSSGSQLAATSGCNGTGNTCARVQITTSLAGTYYARVRASSSSASGTYSVRVLPRYDQGLTRGTTGEPDDLQVLAAPITVGTGGSVSRTIYARTPTFTTVSGDQDFFRFTGAAGGVYVIEVFSVAAELGSVNLSAYNASSSTLASTSGCNGSGNVCARITVTTSIAGTYFFRVRANSSNASGTYSARVLPRYDQGLTHATSGEPDDLQELAGPINVGTANTLTRSIYERNSTFITVAGDQDFYRFSGTAGRTYTAEVMNVAGSVGSMSLYAFNASGTQVAGSSGCNVSGAVCARISFTTSIAGTYFLRTRATSGNTSGTYSIRVS